MCEWALDESHGMQPIVRLEVLGLQQHSITKSSPAPVQSGPSLKIDARVQSSGDPSAAGAEVTMTVHNATDQILDIYFRWGGKWASKPACQLQPNVSNKMKTTCRLSLLASVPHVLWPAGQIRKIAPPEGVYLRHQSGKL